MTHQYWLKSGVARGKSVVLTAQMAEYVNCINGGSCLHKWWELPAPRATTTSRSFYCNRYSNSNHIFLFWPQGNFVPLKGNSIIFISKKDSTKISFQNFFLPSPSGNKFPLKYSFLSNLRDFIQFNKNEYFFNLGNVYQFSLGFFYI